MQHQMFDDMMIALICHCKRRNEVINDTFACFTYVWKKPVSGVLTSDCLCFNVHCKIAI